MDVKWYYLSTCKNVVCVFLQSGWELGWSICIYLISKIVISSQRNVLPPQDILVSLVGVHTFSKLEKNEIFTHTNVGSKAYFLQLNSYRKWSEPMDNNEKKFMSSMEELLVMNTK